MTCHTLFQRCILFLYPILLLIYINFGIDIMRNTLKPLIGNDINIIIKPDILTTTIWILIQLLGIIYHYFPINYRLNNNNLFTFSLLILFIIMFIEYNININKISLKYIQSLTTMTCFAICSYKQYSLFQNVYKQYLWFNGIHYDLYKNNKIIIIIINKGFFYIKYLIYIGCQFIIYYYCFIYLDKCTIVTINLSMHILWSIIIPLPYYLLSTKIKFDLYHNRKQMMYFILTHLLSHIWAILWSFPSFQTRFTFNLTLHHIISQLSLIIFFISLTILPFLFNLYKKYKFNKLIINNRYHYENWWQYILSNNTNFNNFYGYLRQNKIVESLLFVMEFMEYKNYVINKLNSNGYIINNGYLLSLENNYQTVLNQTPIIDIIKQEININQINGQRLKIDLEIFCKKYIVRIEDNEKIEDNQRHRNLFVSFISSNHRRQIIDVLHNDNNIEVIHLFDDAIKEIYDILQLIYIQYQMIQLS